MNLIPEKPQSLTYNYYCTFNSQSVWNTDKKISSIIEIRNRLNSEFLFGKDGVLEAHDKNIRGDMLVLLDDGWDVPPGIEHTETNCGIFGSMIADDEKFPEFAKMSPSEKLKGLSDKIKSMGYAGLGLWVPANHYGEKYRENREKCFADADIFWSGRAKMCAYADVKYLKVDWGYHGRDVEYRMLITDKMKKYSPSAFTEHVIGIYDQPYDPSPAAQNSDDFMQFMQLAKKTVCISDFYRTYDVLDEFSEATTLMRLAKLADIHARAADEYKGIINVEDNPVIAAALGMTMGIMRHKNKPRYNDVTDALIWQRLAPPAKFDPSKLKYSPKLICDSYSFHGNLNEWPYIGSETISQYAPSVMSVNAPLAEVCCTDEYTPFVLNSKNEITGAYTVAVIPVNRNNEKYTAPVDITVRGASVLHPIGIFGDFKILTVHFNESAEGKKIYVQPLGGNDAVPVTEQIKTNGAALQIPGSLCSRPFALFLI